MHSNTYEIISQGYLFITDKCPHQQDSEVYFWSLGDFRHPCGTPSTSLHGSTSQSVKARWQQSPKTSTHILHLQHLCLTWQPCGERCTGQEPPHPSKKCTEHNEVVPLTHTHAPEHTHPEGCEGTAAKISQTVGVASAWTQAAV